MGAGAFFTAAFLTGATFFATFAGGDFMIAFLTARPWERPSLPTLLSQQPSANATASS